MKRSCTSPLQFSTSFSRRSIFGYRKCISMACFVLFGFHNSYRVTIGFTAGNGINFGYVLRQMISCSRLIMVIYTPCSFHRRHINGNCFRYPLTQINLVMVVRLGIIRSMSMISDNLLRDDRDLSVAIYN